MANNGKTDFSLYGLPEEVEHCSKCLMHNQKPFSVNETTNAAGSKKRGMPVDENGVCAACNYNERKDEGIDWQDREQKLLTMLEGYRRNDGYYDCIVSGSGGKDSMTIAHLLKYKYGMHPLTVTYSPVLYTDVGWRNLQSWISKGGFDNYLFSPDGRVSGILAREAFTNLLHPMQPFKFGIKSYSMKMAMRFGIRLVMYGESYAEYGSTDETSTDSPAYDQSFYINDSKDIYIGGLHVDVLKEKHGFCDNDLFAYMPIRSHEIEEHQVRVDCLGWYVRWDPQKMYYHASENCGFEPDLERTEGTYGRYAGIDDMFESIHYFTHYIKFMIGRCRFDASQEIRNGHITREEGVRLARRFEGEAPHRYLAAMLDFMGISEEQFWQRIEEARSPHLWEKVAGVWHPKQELSEILITPPHDQVAMVDSSSSGPRLRERSNPLTP
jgi:N-acetyl sugar amidotransferase